MPWLRPPPCRQIGLTPLQTAKTPELELTLVGKGANPNVADKDGNTPLHAAESSELMAALLEHGADLEAANKVREEIDSPPQPHAHKPNTHLTL